MGSFLPAGTSAQALSESHVRTLVPVLVNIGRHHAQRLGVPACDVDDCAITFAERMLLRQEPALRRRLAVGAEGWVHVCARNHAREYRRVIARQTGPSIPRSVVPAGLFEPAALVRARDLPEARAMRSDLWAAIVTCVDRLSPSAQTLFVQHYMLGLTMAELAGIYGDTPEAVEQALRGARAAIRRSLMRRGIEDGDAYCAA